VFGSRKLQSLGLFHRTTRSRSQTFRLRDPATYVSMRISTDEVNEIDSIEQSLGFPNTNLI